MISLFFAATCVAAVVVALTISLLWGWVVLGAVCVLLLLILAVLKAHKLEPPAGLSPEAETLFRKYGYFYVLRLTCEQYGTASTLTMVAAFVLAVIGAFKDFWWGFALMVVVWVVMYSVSMAFNPSVRLAKSQHRYAQEEVGRSLQRQMEKTAAGR